MGAHNCLQHFYGVVKITTAVSVNPLKYQLSLLGSFVRATSEAGAYN